MTGDAKSKILARRARFVAAALAGLGTLGCPKEPERDPQVCLSQPQPEPEPEPQACLEPPHQPESPDAATNEPPPLPCLSQPMQPEESES